jgi:NTP pyrophosphatase (non-canonical NTP hydrolase)
MNTTQYETFVRDKWLGAAPIEERHLRDMYICTSGLGGETGEVLEKLKKIVRDGQLDSDGLKKELGDVLYYLTYITLAFGFTLDDVIKTNVEKLTDRQTRGTIQGNGDNR